MIPRREALVFWLRLGFISFGGPAGQIAIMHQELVERRRWISERRFLHALNYCMVLPGPEAQQLATYLGWLMHGTWGGVAAGALFVLPGMLILMTLAWAYLAFGETAWLSAIFYGVKPAVVAIVLAAAWRIGSRALRTPLAAAIALASFLASAVAGAPFPVIVLAAALIGVVASRLWPGQLAAGGAGHGAAATDGAPALIGDDTPVPDHARYSVPRLLIHIGSAVALWLAGFTACIAAAGLNGGLTRMAWFFTKAALLTFGGAYAVLPYVYAGAVEQFGWLQPEQMIDGLALGETTPGPLIMVVTFVGFLGGWQQSLLGPGAEMSGALAGALVATFFTFLPSFLFILAGAPLVEATRHELRITAPLAAITAAVVGVIVNLALLFARHTFWPGEIAGMPDLVSVAIAIGAGLALARFRVSVPILVVGTALLGLVLRPLIGVT